ncbi:MAG: hypothetical protein KBD15_01680 [Candidatus Magasanikbacteria bacterium]|nr:hypothetical protein [Candidatus Magasanikbacteria bacterium]
MLRFKIFGFIALALFLLAPGSPTFAVGENITSMSLSSNKVVPGFSLQFTLHEQPNVRQNVNRSPAVLAPQDFLVQIDRDLAYPEGVWGVQRVYVPRTDLSVDAENVYTITAPQESGYYRLVVKNGVGDVFTTEVFQVAVEPFVTIRPPRIFEQGETVSLNIYNEAGAPWNIEQWGNAAGLYNIDVFYFGNGGPISYAAPDGSTAVRIQRTGQGVYTFAASEVVAEYYVGFNDSPGTSVHSTSFDVVARTAPVPTPVPVPTPTPTPLPPVLEPYQDDSETEQNDVDGLPDPAPAPTSTPVRQIVLEDHSETPRPLTPERYSCPLTIGKVYKSSDSPAVYLVVEPRRVDGTLDTSKLTCTRRAFRSSSVFFTYFTSWNEVQVSNLIKNIKDDGLSFMPLGRRYAPLSGTLVKTVADPKVYRLEGNKKNWITSESTFQTLGFRYDWIEDVSEEFLAKYELGSEITDTQKHPPYTLIKVSGDSRVYLLEPDTINPSVIVKRHITSEVALRRLGHRLDRIVTVTRANADQYPVGTPLE